MLDPAITSTIYASVAFSRVVKACFVHSRGFLWLNSSTKIPELATSWCLISQTVRPNALVDHGSFPLHVAMNWSRCSSRTPAVRYIICWFPCTSIQLHLHPIACCFLFLLLPVLQTICNCASRVIYLVAAFAASQWTKWCLRCSWVSGGGVFDETAIILLDSVLLSPFHGSCGAMICCCGSAEMMMMKQSGKSWGRR